MSTSLPKEDYSSDACISAHQAYARLVKQGLLEPSRATLLAQRTQDLNYRYNPGMSNPWEEAQARRKYQYIRVQKGDGVHKGVDFWSHSRVVWEIRSYIEGSVEVAVSQGADGDITTLISECLASERVEHMIQCDVYHFLSACEDRAFVAELRAKYAPEDAQKVITTNPLARCA